ncbi:MAG TPA: dephospho-CoA kinase [Thermoanaerobaculia bacterium]|nr:dephospho-CoA kinase [Thermoanaerobaculia bacterium]
MGADPPPPRRVLRVGLTGGIASGKSTVAARLAEHGIPVLDADRVVHDLYLPGAAGTRAVAEEFGAALLDREGAVDRSRLAERVFADPEALARLNARIHPLVLQAQERWFEARQEASDALGVVEATLLVETGGRQRYDVVIAVSAPEEVRLERAVRRSGEFHREGLRRRIAAQMRDAEREKSADIVLRTDGTKEELLVRVDELAARLREMARRLLPHGASPNRPPESSR